MQNEKLQQDNLPNPEFNRPPNSYTKKVNKEVKNILRKRLITIIATGIVLVLGVTYIILKAIDNYILTIGINNNLEKGIILSDTPDFKKRSVILSADGIKKLSHYTYEWFEGQLEEKDGSHNGNNYIAYTFYLRNEGFTIIDYQYTIEMLGMSKGTENAVRFMVIRNDERVVYAAPNKETGNPEYIAPGRVDELTVPFVNSDTAADVLREDINPGEVDKYTIVIWLEGTDSECVNDIIGGTIRFRMFFNVLIEDDE